MNKNILIIIFIVLLFSDVTFWIATAPINDELTQTDIVFYYEWDYGYDPFKKLDIAMFLDRYYESIYPENKIHTSVYDTNKHVYAGYDYESADGNFPMFDLIITTVIKTERTYPSPIIAVIRVMVLLVVNVVIATLIRCNGKEVNKDE